MVTMTMHVEDYFADALRAKAAEMGKSVNQAVKEMLLPFLGLAAHKEESNPWLKLCGCVSKAEGKRMRSAIAEQDVIDEEIWK